MTREEWEAIIVERTLANDWPDSKIDRAILERGPCTHCGEMMDVVRRGGVLPMAACRCWKMATLLERGREVISMPTCPTCGTCVGYRLNRATKAGFQREDEAGWYYQIECKCMAYRTKL